MLKKIETKRLIIIASFPLWTDIIRSLKSVFDGPIVFDCHDLLEGFGNIDSSLLRKETDLCNLADLLVFSADWLSAYHLERCPDLRGKSTVIRNAADPSAFSMIVKAQQHGLKPTIGYVGALNFWFDAEAVDLAALHHPEWNFVLVGKVESPTLERLRRRENIAMIGEVRYEDLAVWMRKFDVGLIPFVVSPLTRATNPIKLYEYFSCGLPVVSSRLPEVERYSDLTYLASSPAEFVRQIERAVAEDDQDLRSRRRDLAVREDWSQRTQMLVDAIEETVKAT